VFYDRQPCDAERAEIWLDASSLVAGIKMLLGADPKED
jgi:hypothetical protein